MTATKILVVEDEPIVALNLQDRLESLGYDIIGVASEGVEAIRKVNETRPDLILMDIILEGTMDGVVTAGEIRRQHDIPVIYLTAYADQETIHRAKATGPYGYIVKPFEIKNLHSTIEVVLNRHQIDKMLSQHERWLASVMQCIDDAVVVTNRLGQIIYSNEAAESLLSLSHRTIIGQEISNVIQLTEGLTGVDFPTGQLIQRALQARLPQRLPDKYLLLTNSRQVQVEIRAMPLKDDQDRIIGAIMVFHDSTIEHHVVKQIEATLLEKEILLKEIHHRVKNNLQIIASLLDLQSENIQDRTLIKIFENSRHRIRSMALLHEELYQSTETTTISMAPYFNSLVSYLYYAYGINTAKIALQFDVAPISLILDQAIPCGLIVNELVTNSLKHAFPAGRSGSILVRFQLIDNDQYQLTVADDGIGLMGDFDLQQADSFGLQLVALLTRQLEGTYEIDQTDKTAFTITFPRA